MALFNRVTIVGLGLIGGSLGMAIKRRRLAREVVGTSRRSSTLRRANARGAIDVGTTDLGRAVQDADLVVLAMVGQSPAGDVDADGILDPLFSVLDVAGSVVPAALIAPNGVRLRVTVAHWNFQDLRKSFIMRKLSDECVFRNSQ